MKNTSTPKPELIDDDNPEWTEAMIAEAKPSAGIPALQVLLKARGRPKAAKTKKSTTLRLDADVVDYFKHSGKGWQTRINEALKEYVIQHR